METHMGDMPLNARVKVTYGDTKKVDFSYPRGEKLSPWGKFFTKFVFIWSSY